MKAVKIRIVNLILAVIVALFAVGYAFAWFVEGFYKTKLNIGGSSAGAYFAGGNGTESDPYQIASNYHLYNLAWLNNLGRLVDGNNQPAKYYFKLTKNIDMNPNMNPMWLPPIGNDEHPFMGEFDGGGNVISSLRVTTNKRNLSNSPIENDPNYTFSDAVGMFGMTDKNSVVKNFILDNPQVVVANTNTKYTGTAENMVAGIAVGCVNGSAKSIGVKADAGKTAALNLEERAGAKYSTFNSIIGKLGTDVQSSVTGGGHTSAGGSGDAFGANFDIKSVVDRLHKIYEVKYGLPYQQGNKNPPIAGTMQLPQIDAANSEPVPAEGAKIAFTIDTSKSSYELPNPHEEIAENNIGYFLGNQNKFNTKNITYVDKMTPSGDWTDWRTSVGAGGNKVPVWFYTFSYDVIQGDVTDFKPGLTGAAPRALTQEEYDALPEGIKKLLGNVGESKEFKTIRINQDGVGTGNYGDVTNKQQWSYHGQISWHGGTYGEGFKNVDGYAVDENGNVYKDQYGAPYAFNKFTGGVSLPNNAIWFKPAQAGKFEFVMYAESDSNGFILNKITRTNATAEEPFKVDPSKGGSDVEMEIVLQQSLPSGIFFYYSYDVKPEEIAAGNVEFLLQQNRSKGAHFIYLDIGASAPTDTGEIDREKQVSAVDFIYDNVTIKQTKAEGDKLEIGNFVVVKGAVEALYVSSKTSVYFEGVELGVGIAFVRLNPETETGAQTISLTVTGADSAKVTSTNAGYVKTN